MGRDDWFQNKTWDTATEARFNEKLCRARNKAWYLRVQAGHLVTADPRATLSLLDRYFALGDDLAKAQAFADQAKAYLALGAQEEALALWKKHCNEKSRFQILKRGPGVTTQ